MHPIIAPDEATSRGFRTLSSTTGEARWLLLYTIFGRRIFINVQMSSLRHFHA